MHYKLQTVLQKIKDCDTNLCIFICKILVFTKMYLGRFKMNSVFRSYDTRNKSDLINTSHNTKLLERTIAYSGVLIYYKLSHEIKSVKCIMKFKKILIGFLLEKIFHSVEPFVTHDP